MLRKKKGDRRIIMETTEFKKWIELTPAFDKRSPEPSKNYGIHGVNLCFYLKGPKGVIQFLIYTNWHLKHVADELKGKYSNLFKPLPADVGYHAYEPQYEGQLSHENCSLLDNKTCYYDGSGLAAYDMFDILTREGSEGVWKEMEKWYNERLCHNDHP